MSQPNDQPASRYPAPPIAPVPTLPTAAIRRLRPCAHDFGHVERQFSATIPLIPETVDLLVSQGVDVLWAGLHLLTAAERGAFIFWTLRYRQPHIAAIFRRAGMVAKAEEYAALPFETRADAEAALPFLERIRDTAWDTAWVAAWAAARDTAWDTAWADRDTAWAAAWAAAWDDLQRAGGRWVLATLAAREGAA